MIDTDTASPGSGSSHSDGAPRAALVLGAAVWPGEQASPSLERRARHAASLWRSGQVDLIIGCGGLGLHPPTEAEMIRRICFAAGVPDGVVLLEDHSHNTLENIRNAMPLLSEAGAARVVLVTDGYHAPRARLIGRKLGLRCTSSAPEPIGTPTRRRLRSRLREIPAWLYYRFWPGAVGAPILPDKTRRDRP